MSGDQQVPTRRVLPKLMACMTRQSLENMRNRTLFNLDPLDSKAIRRRKQPLYKCLIMELMEDGYAESSNYLQDLLYDNEQLVNEDEIGIVVDLRKRDDYLEYICSRLQLSEKERGKDNIKNECLVLLNLGLYFTDKEKGILWLAEKFYLVAMAVASKFHMDGGRMKALCKYYYAKFLLDKFPGAEIKEARSILTEIRDNALGRSWPLHEDVASSISLFSAIATQLHRVLLQIARCIRKTDPPRAERLARLAERRGQDAGDPLLVAEAIIEVGISQLVMNNLNNAKKTFARAFKINTDCNNIEGLCITRVHMAAVLQRLGEHEEAAQVLTDMGALAMEHSLNHLLGRALHLLGELHLRRERPDLGTQHLAAAFSCFMGCIYTHGDDKPLINYDETDSHDLATIDLMHCADSKEVYKEEAEQSRIMTAVSAGQELIASYFDLLRDARYCTVATVKCIDWKMARHGWWVHRPGHDVIPCLCPKHNRTPLDVIRMQLEKKRQSLLAKVEEENENPEEVKEEDK